MGSSPSRCAKVVIAYLAPEPVGEVGGCKPPWLGSTPSGASMFNNLTQMFSHSYREARRDTEWLVDLADIQIEDAMERAGWTNCSDLLSPSGIYWDWEAERDQAMFESVCRVTGHSMVAVWPGEPEQECAYCHFCDNPYCCNLAGGEPLPYPED